MDPKTKAVVILSGGMDSSTLVAKLVKDGYAVFALSINYGQRHRRELTCAKKFCKKLGLDHKIVNMKQIGKQILQGSALTGGDVEVPFGYYEAQNMKLTVVPSRNLLLLSLAISYAVSIGAQKVFYGAHSGDHAIYPDCRPEFITAVKVVAGLCDFNPIELEAPFSEMDKGDIVKLGVELRVDYKLTHTCYCGWEIACGQCGACQERIAAFVKAGVKDPIPYKGGWKAAVENAKKVAEEFKAKQGVKI